MRTRALLIALLAVAFTGAAGSTQLTDCVAQQPLVGGCDLGEGREQELLLLGLFIGTFKLTRPDLIQHVAEAHHALISVLVLEDHAVPLDIDPEDRHLRAVAIVEYVAHQNLES
jgi:hypothetical protein